MHERQSSESTSSQWDKTHQQLHPGCWSWWTIIAGSYISPRHMSICQLWKYSVPVPFVVKSVRDSEPHTAQSRNDPHQLRRRPLLTAFIRSRDVTAHVSSVVKQWLVYFECQHWRHGCCILFSMSTNHCKPRDIMFGWAPPSWVWSNAAKCQVRVQGSKQGRS